MFNWKNEILKNLNSEEYTPLMFFALDCGDSKELEELKDVILLLKKEGSISLRDKTPTPEEILDCVKNYYSNKGTSVDKERQDKRLKWASEQKQDLKNFFNNSACLVKE